VINSIHYLVQLYQKDHKAKITEFEAQEFMKTLNQTIHTEKIKGIVNDVPSASTFIWTSTQKLHDLELCSILNYAIRSDRVELLQYALVFCKGINAMCVRKIDRTEVYWPAENVTYRGSGILNRHLSFYKEGVKYRAPMFLSTSAKRQVVSKFLSRTQPYQEPVLWYFHFDPVKRCNNVNFLPRSMAHSPEDEFLFSAYSVFTVKQVILSPQPNWQAPHEIHLEVAPDSSLEPEDLPLASWC